MLHLPIIENRKMPSERRLVSETPLMYASAPLQAYIRQEMRRPCKQWIHDVLNSKREVDRVKLRTDTFVLLPDVDSGSKRSCWPRVFNINNNLPSDELTVKPYINRTYRSYYRSYDRFNDKIYDTFSEKTTLRYTHMKDFTHKSFHWLAVVADTELHSLRDLRGCHIQMLQSLYIQSCQKILEETGVQADQIMVYVHYPPSVYQLHIHFKHPVGPHVLHDTFRIHSLLSIINNLSIDPDFYAKSVLQLPVYQHTELCTALDLISNPNVNNNPNTSHEPEYIESRETLSLSGTWSPEQNSTNQSEQKKKNPNPPGSGPGPEQAQLIKQDQISNQFEHTSVDKAVDNATLQVITPILPLILPLQNLKLPNSSSQNLSCNHEKFPGSMLYTRAPMKEKIMSSVTLQMMVS